MSDLALASTTALVEVRRSMDIACGLGELIGGLDTPPEYAERQLAPEVAR